VTDAIERWIDAAERGAIRFLRLDDPRLRRGKSMAAMKDDPQTTVPYLSKRLREIAGNGTHERALELYARADEVERAYNDRTITLDFASALTHRARRLLFDLTGEDDVVS
jgi:hypothetical protein